jgi:hypothetical protein
MDRRALNRALLARQGLLERERTPALELVRRLAGLQTQNPAAGHLALWSRIADYDPAELDDLLLDRRVLRVTMMRATKHLMTREDVYAWRSAHEPVLRRVVSGAFRRQLEGVDLDTLAAAAAEIDEPLTTMELGRRLSPRFGDRDPQALGIAAHLAVPYRQPPPRGLWGRPGKALNERLPGPFGPPDPDAIVLRYLEAFGPASVMDAQAWCGITRLRESFERLRPQLATFEDERGRELFDLPDAPRPPAATPAPVRFLPVFDNVCLAYDDRSRIVAGEHRGTVMERPWPHDGFVLVDGFAAANWHFDRKAGRLEVTAYAGEVDVGEEAAAFEAFLRRGVSSH